MARLARALEARQSRDIETQSPFLRFELVRGTTQELCWVHPSRVGQQQLEEVTAGLQLESECHGIVLQRLCGLTQVPLGQETELACDLHLTVEPHRRRVIGAIRLDQRIPQIGWRNAQRESLGNQGVEYQHPVVLEVPRFERIPVRQTGIQCRASKCGTAIPYVNR